MSLWSFFITVLASEVKKLHKNNLQLRVIGDKSRFNERLQKKIEEAEALTSNNTGMVVNIAANYGGKWDIQQAVKSIATQVKEGDLSIDDIDEPLITSHPHYV